MADKKITELTALTTVADEDVLAIVDDPGGTPATKKITRGDLIGSAPINEQVEIEHSSWPPFLATRTSTQTVIPLGAIAARHETTGDMADGFGVGIGLVIRDSADVDNIIGLIYAIRDGADNTGYLSLRPYSSGSGLEAMILYPSGIHALPETSRVQARRTTSQTISDSTFTDFVFSTEDLDTRSEYNNSTGIFTATKDGFYLVTWMITSADVAWDAGEVWTTTLSKNGSTSDGSSWRGFRCEAQVTCTCQMTSNGSAIVYLNATDTLRIKAYHTRGSDTDNVTGGNFNYLSIHKLS